MSSAIRCKARDEHGHHCKRKAGHELVKPAEGADDKRPHTAFGHVWKGKGH